MRKIFAFLCFTALAACALAQEQKIAEQPKLDVAQMHDALPDKDYTAKTSDTSFVAPNGERVQRLEIVIPGVTPKQAWEAVSANTTSTAAVVLDIAFLLEALSVYRSVGLSVVPTLGGSNEPRD